MVNELKEDGNEERSGPIPPYISFQSLRTLIDSFKQHGMPGRVDRSVLTRFSNGVGGQIVTALTFLGLIDSGKAPTPEFRKLVEGFGTPAGTEMLAQTLRTAYAPMFRLNLETATPGQFVETFRKSYPAKDETARKCISFFLAAIKEAKIGVSAYILKGTKTRTATKRRAKTNGDAQPENGEQPGKPDHTPIKKHRTVDDDKDGQGMKPLEYQLIDLMKEPDIGDDVKQSIWNLVQFLSARATTGKKAA